MGNSSQGKNKEADVSCIVATHADSQDIDRAANCIACLIKQLICADNVVVRFGLGVKTRTARVIMTRSTTLQDLAQMLILTSEAEISVNRSLNALLENAQETDWNDVSQLRLSTSFRMRSTSR